MANKRRERIREMTREEIKQAALQQMEAEGTASLSLRTVAKTLDMAPSAIYYYFANRDELITALVVDAFNALGNAVEEAYKQIDPADYSGQALAITLAYRNWAKAFPVAYKLIYGTPIPGYHAPREITEPAAGRGFALFIAVCRAAWEAGQLALPKVELSDLLRQQLADLSQRRSFNVPLEVVYQTLAGWVKLYGLISLEVYGSLEIILGEADAFYQHEVYTCLKAVGFQLEN